MEPARRTALIGEIITRVAEGSLSLPVAAVHAFDDAASAARENSPGRVGKLLLTP
jgi:NADPH:quinone reductase-like Zn-dependent oxidoreductase